MYVLSAACVLLALSVNSAADVPSTCEDLTRPLVLNDLRPIYGKWVFTQGTTDYQKYTAILELVNSSLVELLPTSSNETWIFKQANMINGTCQHSTANMTTVNNTFQIVERNFSSTGAFLPTCADCLLISFTSVEGGEVSRSLYIFGRTGKLSPSELETFKRQGECLKLPPASFVYDGQTEFCSAMKEPHGKEN